MKKLTKKKLDELALEMPVVNEKSQREYVGGYYFCGGSGDYLSQNLLTPFPGGPRDTIKVLTGSDISLSVASGHLASFCGGTALSSLLPSQKIGFYLGFGSQIGNFNHDLYSSSYVFVNSAYGPAISINSSNQLVFNESGYNLCRASTLTEAWTTFNREHETGIEL